MQIIKNFLASIGLIIVLIFAGLAYLGMSIFDIQDEHTPFVEQFMQDFSQNWQINDVRSQLSDSFIEDIETTKGHHLIRTLESMGKYQSMSNLIVSQYNSNSAGKAVNINFTAHFSKGSAAITLHLIKLDDVTKINGLYVTPIEGKEPIVIEQHV